ncbi:MAG: HAD family hydrolase [Pseudomonadales bacterium]
MGQIKLITFDLDNTLWNVESVVIKAEKRMRHWLDGQVPGFDVRFPPDVMAQLRNTVIEENPALRHDLSKMREEILFRAIVASAFSRKDARTLARRAFEIFLDARHEVEYFDGALETLERLSQDYVLAALTNGNADFRRLKLGQYFDFGYSSASVGASKPAPDIFHAALKHAQTHPSEAVHVGDHLRDDVEGALGVGMHTVWVNLDRIEPPEEAATPTHTVNDLSEIPETIERIGDASSD